jgi:hypothetical protein
MLFQTELDPRGAAVDALHAATAIYTAGPIVEGLLRRIDWPNRPGRLLDPSAGDGAFLLGALALLEPTPKFPGELDRVRGMEIHPKAVREGREHVAKFLVSRGFTRADALAKAEEILTLGDFLMNPPETGEFAVIAGNPPYLRAVNLPAFFRELYGAVVPEFAQGDILHAFLARCTDLMPAEGGVIALVTSDRWMTNLSTGPLRAHIGTRFGVSHLAQLDVTTAFYRPKSRRKGTPPRIHPIEVVLEAGAQPLTAEIVSLDGRAPYTGPTLADIATVRIAPWMGPEGVFVVDQALGSKLTGVTLIPAVDVDDIARDRDELTGVRRYALKVEGDGPPVGAARTHLESQFHRMPEKCRKRGCYWLPPESINLPLTGERMMIPRIARRIRAVPLPEGVLPLNHNIQIAIPATGVSMELVRAVLLSDEAQAWAQSTAPHLENGYLSLTTMLLRRMPIPERFLAQLPARPALAA